MSVCKGKVVAVVVVVVVVVLLVVFDSQDDFSVVTLTLVDTLVFFCPTVPQKNTIIMSTEIMAKKIGIRDRALMRLVPLASILVNETNFSTIIFQIKQVRLMYELEVCSRNEEANVTTFYC